MDLDLDFRLVFHNQHQVSRVITICIWNHMYLEGSLASPVAHMVKKKKKSACNEGDPCSVPGSGRSPGEGHGNPLQFSCLENPMDRGAWRAAVHRVTKSQTQLSD